jgi:preprotein translocase subunit SecA
VTAIPAADHNEPLVGWTHPPGRELPDFDAALAEMRNVESKLVALEPDWESHARRLRERARRGESRDVLLPEAFALVRLASEKVLGLRHYDEQIVAGMLLARGYIVEMATGEGKTLAATTAAFLEAVTGGRSFIVTVNDYLARRDMEWMGPLFRALGLSVGLVTSHHERNRNMRRYSYAADIVYVTNRELVWDYLRDHLGFQRSDVCLPELPPVIIDEADLVLLDEARIPFIVSGMSGSDDANWDAVRRRRLRI